MEWDIPYLRRIGYSPQGRNSGVKSLFDRTEPAIGRTRPADGSDFLREIAAVCRPFLFAFWLSLPSPHGSDRCASIGRRISPNIPDLRILHVHTRAKIWRIILCASILLNVERESNPCVKKKGLPKWNFLSNSESALTIWKQSSEAEELVPSSYLLKLQQHSMYL